MRFSFYCISRIWLKNFKNFKNFIQKFHFENFENFIQKLNSHYAEELPWRFELHLNSKMILNCIALHFENPFGKSMKIFQIFLQNLAKSKKFSKISVGWIIFYFFWLFLKELSWNKFRFTNFNSGVSNSNRADSRRADSQLAQIFCYKVKTENKSRLNYMEKILGQTNGKRSKEKWINLQKGRFFTQI